MRLEQPDLFASPAPQETTASAVPEAFVTRIRQELCDTLERVTVADALPWDDLSKALLAEMRFRSVANWLPAAEAALLRERFEVQMARLYAPLLDDC